MTQIVDKKLKNMCNHCQSLLDKPCAWLSLGNEYCTEIMDLQQELDKYKKVIDKIKEIMESNLSNVEKLITIDILLKTNISIKDELLEEIE